MYHYPVLLNLHQARVAIVGLGQVGKRKLFSLLPCGPASIVLIDPALDETRIGELKEKIATDYPEFFTFNKGVSNKLLFYAKVFTPNFLEGCSLAFAATSDAEVNTQIFAECRKKNILCNCADSEKNSDFIIPASIRNGDITISIATGGKSPALARVLKKDLAQWMGTRYARLAKLMGRIRPLIINLPGDTFDHAVLFRQLVQSPLGVYLENYDKEEAETLLRVILPSALHPFVGELLDDI